MTGRVVPPLGGEVDVSVITATRGRPLALLRAVASVQAQDYPGTIEHLVVVDDDPDALAALKAEPAGDRRPLTIQAVGPPADQRQDHRTFVYRRLAQLLNVGIGAASGGWIAFLDDDNEFEPDHICSLVSLATETQSLAVHSGRAFVWPDGSPYLDPVLPSAPTPAEGRRLYELLCDRGVWLRGTNIVLDRVDPGATPTSPNSTAMGSNDPVFLVDQNVWLVARHVLQRVPVPEDHSLRGPHANDAPDDRMLGALLAAGITPRSTSRPTVRYTVGGISAGSFLERQLEGKDDEVVH